MPRKITAIVTLLLTSTEAWSAGSLPDCSASQLSMQGANEEVCISTCSAVANISGVQLSSGQSGFCVGDASESRITLYNVSLGKSTQAEPTCDLWNGEFVIDKSQYAAGQTISTGGSFKACSPANYDAVFLTTSRMETFSGSTSFPDGSGKVVRTTSRFAGESGNYNERSSWLETSTSHTDDTRYYVRPTSGWNNAYKKLASNPSAADLDNASSEEMTFDWGKNLVFYGNPSSSGMMEGWYCEDGETQVCERLETNNKIQIRLTSDVDGVSFPENGLTVTDIIQPNWDISYFGLNQDTERGLRFLWHNDNGELQYLGVNPGESGLQITISPFDVSGG